MNLGLLNGGIVFDNEYVHKEQMMNLFIFNTLLLTQLLWQEIVSQIFIHNLFTSIFCFYDRFMKV